MTQAPSSQRLFGLDAARAVAVLAMVMGHSLDAVLSDSSRLSEGMLAYWQFRTFTAPLFLIVSGWAVMTSVDRMKLTGWSVVRRYGPRVGLLFGLGLILRLPVWNWSGFWSFDRAVWQHFLAFDALHVIASSLALGILFFSIISTRWLRLGLLVMLAAGIPLVSEWVWAAASAPEASWLSKWWLGGLTSPFPLFPWAGFFFAGAVLGQAVNARASKAQKVALLVGMSAWAFRLSHGTPVLEMPPASAILFIWRLSVPMLILAGCWLLPDAVAKRLAPIGRASLWVYVIHLPIAYGWAYWPGLDNRVGHSLEAWQGLTVALGVVLFSVTAALVGKRLRASLKPRALADSLPPAVEGESIKTVGSEVS